MYGKDFFEGSRENLAILFEMANTSLVNKQPPIFLSNNAEGALLYHMILQNLEGDLMLQGMSDILTSALYRLKS